MQSGFKNLEAVGRTFEAEAELSLTWRSVTESEWDALSSEIASAAEFLGVEPMLPDRPKKVLSESLTAEQRKVIDAALMIEYAAALERDEAARDEFDFSECGEKMLDLRALASAVGCNLMWSKTPFNAACGEFGGKPRIFWMRKSVAELFVNAGRAFNSIGLIAQVEDCYRPPAVQEGLLKRRIKMIREEFPALGREEVLCAAYAKTAAAPYRAAHMAGAAIDFTLRDSEGRPLDLGNAYPAGGAASILFFPYVTWDQFRTRALFYSVSLMAGLCPYPGEDWHLSQGDGLAAIFEGRTSVRYCALKDFNRVSGEIVPYDLKDAMKMFSIEGLL